MLFFSRLRLVSFSLFLSRTVNMEIMSRRYYLPRKRLRALGVSRAAIAFVCVKQTAARARVVHQPGGAGVQHPLGIRRDSTACVCAADGPFYRAYNIRFMTHLSQRGVQLT